MTKKFYLTFGQKHPAKDGYVLVEANDYHHARDLVERAIGKDWSMLYDEDNWKQEYFPKGQLGIIK